MFRLSNSFSSMLAAFTLSCIVLDANSPTLAQITSAGDRTGTVVNQNGSDFAITGGSLSGDRGNLFHNFASFNLNSSQSATFFADPAIQNILSKISGGNPSFIDGLIQISGSEANLFLINPSGIVFGNNAQLDVDGDFTASTATKIGFGDAIWQEGIDYRDLVGSPTRFYFDGTAAIINAADLEVGRGNSINLLGSNIVNTGTLVAEEGNIQLIAVPGTNTLYLNQNGLILGLEIAPQDSDLSITNLAELLTGSDLATGLSIDDQGTIKLDADQSSVSPQSGVATISGTLDVSGKFPTTILNTTLPSTDGGAGLLVMTTDPVVISAAQSATGMVLVSDVTLNEDGSRFVPVEGQGGAIAIFGRDITLQGATLDASGENGGGEILVGGDYQGQGDRPTAVTSRVDATSVLNASATGLGDGGKAIVWADGATWFHGTTTAKGGNLGGDGGLIETSGKGFLDVTGARINTSAQTGWQTGTWLLDPVNLTIQAGTDDDINGNPDFSTTGIDGLSILSELTLEAALEMNNVTITTAGGTGGDGDLSLNATIDSVSGNSLTLTSRGFNFLGGGFNLGGDLTFNLNSVNPIAEVSPFLGESIQAAHDAIGIVVGTSTLNLGAGTYQRGAELVFTKDLTLNGSGANNTFLLGDNSYRILSTSGNVSINDLTIQDGNAILSNSEATDNSDRGGGIYNSGSLTVTNTTFFRNRADYAGGAIANDLGSSLTVENSTFANNSADYGGGIDNNLGSTSSINRSTFADNLATEGGGIYNSGSLTVTNTTFVGNRAEYAGGAIANYIDSNLTVENSTFFDNAANTYGGGIDNYAGFVTISNSTFANNAAIDGGGIANDGTVVYGVTTYGTVTLANSIIADSPDGGDIFNGEAGDLTFSGSNLIETGTVLGTGNVDGVITLSGDPLLSALGNYGGSTPTLALLPGSIAIDAANTDSMNDQRGLGIVGNRDLGAFESQGFTLTADPASTPQSTTVATDFTNPLSVIVTANNPDEPVANGIVSFLTPTTGASLAGEDVQTTTIDGSGVASLVAKANTVSGGFNHEYLVTATTTGATTNADFTLQNLAAAIANLTINAGDAQSTVVNTPFSNPLVVTATDQYGNLVPHATIHLTSLGTTANLTTPTLNLVTDHLGQVNTVLTANTIAGKFTVSLTGDTASNNFTLRNNADVPNSLAILSGNNQSTVVNTRFANNLTVAVFDQYGNPVPNATINLSAIATRASLQTPNFSIVTNSFGQASTDLAANTVSGSFHVALNSVLGKANGTLSLTNLAGAIANLTINSGNNQSTVVNTPFTQPLTLTATDQYGNLVSNATINLIAPGTGASLKNPNLSLVTDRMGQANTMLTANTIAGGFTVNLTANTTSRSVSNSVTLTNLADVPNSFTIVSGNNQSTVVNTAFRDPLTVQVFDRYNNLVPNAKVSVTVPGSGASLNTPSFSLVTDGTGQASTSLTANTRAGNFDLNLNLDRTNANRNIPLSNLADQPAIILPVSGDGQTTNVGATFADPLKVKVTDQYGNPIANFPVTFQVQKGTTGAIAILEKVTSTTDPNGIVQMPLRANGIGGSHQVLANGQGLNNVAFTLENTPLNESNCPPDCDAQNQEEEAKTTDKDPSLNTGNTLNQNTTAVSHEQTFSTVEIEQTAEYSNYLGIDPVTPLTVDQAKNTLATLDAQTDTKTAYLSLRFRPNGVAPLAKATSTSALLQPATSTKAFKSPDPEWTKLPLAQVGTPDKSMSDALEVVITTGNNDIVVKSLPITRGQLLRLNSELLRFIGRPEAVFQELLNAKAQALYQQTFEPLEETLQTLGVDNLLLSLGEDLRSVPWGALYDGDRYLIEKYSIGITPNLSLTDTRYRSLQDRGVLVMGASDFDALDDLPAVPTEIAMVAAQFGTDQYFLNQDFTRENLIEARQKLAPGIIHLATHASFVGGDLDKSYIQLWGDERLAISEMGDLQWFAEPPVELLVLSACQTALGDANSDLGFGGLAVKSGVRSAVASLWSVSDVGTLALMGEFYKNLSDPTIRTKAKALQQAQIALIRGEVQLDGNQLRRGERSPYVIDLPETPAEIQELDLAQPYSWAAFTLIGSPW